MRRRNFENFPTTKSSCGTRWGKKREEWLYPCLEDGRRMMRRTPTKQNKTKKQKKNHDNKIKPTPVQPRPRPPKIKILSNPAAGPKSIQKRDVHMCITGEKQTKQNATEKKNTMSCNCSYDWKRGARNEDMNFCVNMVKCTVCMSVYDYICCHYMRGGYRVLLEYETSHYTLFVQTFFWDYLGFWGGSGPRRWKWKLRPFYFNNLPVKEANSRLQITDLNTARRQNGFFSAHQKAISTMTQMWSSLQGNKKRSYGVDKAFRLNEFPSQIGGNR